MGKVAVFCTKPTLYANNGYSFAFGFYKYLSTIHDIIVVVPHALPFLHEQIIHINNHLAVHTVVPSEEFYFNHNCSIADFEYDFATVAHTDSLLVNKVFEIVGESQIIICDSFLWCPFAKAVFPEKKIILRSLDVQFDQLEQVYASVPLGDAEKQRDRDRYKDLVISLERKAYSVADCALVLTESDADRLSELYQIPRERFSILPICIENIEMYKGFSPIHSGGASKPLDIVFIGYLLDDPWGIVNAITRVAATIPNVTFHIVGKYNGSINEKNIILYGAVDEEKKREIILSCDCALNLSVQTYGMNVKMLDYMLLGCPIIATDKGTRGYHMEKNIHYFPCEMETLALAIQSFMELSVESRALLAHNAYELLFEDHSYGKYWPSVISTIGTPLPDLQDSNRINLSGKNVLVFGCGKESRTALNFIRDKGGSCIGFTDNKETLFGTLHLGHPVHAPVEALLKVKNDKDCFLLIATSTPRFLKEIYTQASNILCETKKIFVYFQNRFNPPEIDYGKLL